MKNIGKTVKEITVKCPNCLKVVIRPLYGKEGLMLKVLKECYKCGESFWYFPATGQTEKTKEDDMDPKKDEIERIEKKILKNTGAMGGLRGQQRRLMAKVKEYAERIEDLEIENKGLNEALAELKKGEA
jgi:hypothetical protein